MTSKVQHLVLMFSAAALLCSCASAPTQSYRPRNTEDSWQISGEYTPLTEALAIRINGQEVMDGRLSFFGSTAELHGFYQDQPVTASCYKRLSWGGNKTECQVLVSNERAALLQF